MHFLQNNVTFFHKIVCIYTVSGKKGATLFLPVTLGNVNRFSKFFYHHTLQKICSETVNKYPIIIYTRRYTTL